MPEKIILSILFQCMMRGAKPPKYYAMTILCLINRGFLNDII